MKITKYIFVLLAISLLSACSKDFLDKTSFEQVNTESFYKTESDALAAINAAYQPLQRPKLYNLRMWTTDIMAGNSEVGGNPSDANDGTETKAEANFTTTTDNAGVLDLWRGPWPGILYCNIVLDKVPTIPMDSTLKTRILGEAKFLRGLYYFTLVRLFGDVPLITTPAWGKPGEDIRPHRVSRDLIYNQIIKDLSEAMVQLPRRENYATADIGRASKGAAAGMLAKVYLTLGNNWSRVVNLCDTVTSWGYQLNPKYEDNFNPDAENTVESLFEIQYVGNSNNFWDDQNQSGWQSNFMGPRDWSAITAGWGWNQPTQEFVDSYESGDLRKDVTIFYKGCPKFDGSDYDPSLAYVTGYNVRKFIVKKSYMPTGSSGSPLNFPVLRYSDVLLMKAEALNELGQTADASTPLLAVRHRAGLLNDMLVQGLSQKDFRDAVLKERRIELAFEGQRWFDLIRVNNGQWGLDFLHSIGKTNATTKHLLLPIPLQEIDQNSNLLPNNSGY